MEMDSRLRACEKIAEPVKSGLRRRPRAGGAPYKSLFQLDKWIPAFAGMMLRSLAEVCNFDFFTRSFAGETLRQSGAAFGRISR